MSLRWRPDGRLLCGAKHPALEDDTYIDDRLHYLVAVEMRVVEPHEDEEISGEWSWIVGDYPV